MSGLADLRRVAIPGSRERRQRASADILLQGRHHCPDRIESPRLQGPIDRYEDRLALRAFLAAVLKQNLKVKTFVGTSETALQTQIWTALIAMLLLKYVQFRSSFSWSLWNLVAFLRWSLFTYRDLWKWIDDSFQHPPQPPALP